MSEMSTVDLTGLAESGVLFIANERFFWKFGLALTWNYDPATGHHTNLHVTEWADDDGLVERIEADPSDPVYAERRKAFDRWRSDRIERMPPEERPDDV